MSYTETNNNLWILTEERPKNNVLIAIFKKFALDRKLSIFVDTLRIIPILKDNKFTFTYEVIGLRCSQINKIYIKTTTGKSSFVDFLVFHQNSTPTNEDEPIYAIEETKTDDKESRNTGVYQRCSKFVYINHFYPNVQKIMLYNLQIDQKEKPSDTYIFGTRLLKTLGVTILGKKIDEELYKPFNSVEEIIRLKSSMRAAPKGNVPITIKKINNNIFISGRLEKNGKLAHDPNIGAISAISAALRKLGWKESITITNHGLKQSSIGTKNKFLQLANILDLSLENLNIPKNLEISKSDYWNFDLEGEKLGTIFIHLTVENFSHGYSIFENHAGSEKGYFITSKQEHIPLGKYKNREEYKKGDKNQIIHIPDLILVDPIKEEIINIEGKKYQFRLNGIKELENYDYIEKNYVTKYFPKFKILRTVVLYGSDNEKIIELEIGFLLNENGKLILGINAPNLFKEAITNLIDFWK